MHWFMIYLLNTTPLEYTVIGQYDTFEKCHAEAVHQNKESAYVSKFACIGKPANERTHHD